MVKLAELKNSAFVWSLLAATFLLFASEVTFAQGQTSNRTISLLPMADGIFEKTSGRVFIFQQETSPFEIFVEFNIRNLPLLSHGSGADAFALYATTPTFGRLRLITFNGTISGFITLFLPEPDDPIPPEVWLQAWMEDDITIRVFAENDDGHDAPDPGGFLVLEGMDSVY